MKLTRTLLTLLVCATVVLAGCTGMGGLPGDSVGGADDGAAAGGNDASDGGTGGNSGAEGSGGANDSASGNSTNEAGATDRSAAGSGGGNESNSDSGASGSNGSSGAESDGVNQSVESDGAAKTDIEPRTADWLNLTEKEYVFAVNDAENGTGTVTFEPNETAEPGTFASLYPIVSYEGDDSLEAAYTARAEQTGDPTSPVLQPLAIAGTLALGIPDDGLAVGYENTTTSGGKTLTTAITGVESYASVECYATDISIDGNLQVETCIVPYSDETIATGFPPYAAFYDEEGNLVLEVKLTEIKEG